MYTAIKIYKGLIQPHFDYCRAVWDGLTQHLRDLSLNLAMTRTPDVFLTRLLGTVYRLEGLNKKANLMYKCINNLAPAYICNLFTTRTPNYYFRNAKKNWWSKNQELITWSVASVAWRFCQKHDWAAKPQKRARTHGKINFLWLMFLTVSFHWIRLPKPLFVKPFARVV